MVERIPYADREKVKKLPAEAKLILSMAKGKISNQEYKIMENTFVDVMPSDTKQPKPVFTEKSMYAGLLNQYWAYDIINEYGLYNPTQIPLAIYEKMSKDPDIALATAVIKCTISGLNKRIECEDVKQGKIIDAIVNKVYNRTTISLTDAVRMGFAAGEKCWDWTRIVIKDFDEDGNKKTIVDDYFYTIDKIKFPNPTSIRMRVDEKGNFLGLTQQNPMTGGYKKINSNKTVLYSHNVEWGNWFGNARYANIYPAWYWGQVLTQFALKYYERLGQPLTVVRAPPGTSTDSGGNKIDNLTHALKIGQGAISNSVVALPSGLDKSGTKPMWDINLLGDVPRGNMFIDILNHFTSKIYRGLFIPDRMGLASDGSPHSASGASAGDTLDVFIMIEQSFATELENVWNEQIIPDIQKYNFPQNEIVEASLIIEKLDYNKKLLLKEMLLRMVMLEAGMIREGKTPKHLPSVAKICEILDVPIEKFNEMMNTTEIVPTVRISEKKNADGTNAAPIDTKIAQDKNNADRGTIRKERSGKTRSVKEKR
jgi:hypothetical protein